ncbi:MAG: hypothetical protein E7632_07185 [Ruminococcaceae bacterium]|nr:hypothetical protein [Oscillospiraceae bacterium]
MSLLILSALLLQCIGCGNSEAADDGQNFSSDDVTVTETAAEYTVPDVDYGGKTVNITGYNYPGSIALLKYNIALDEENGDVINDAIVARNRAVEEALNVNIELIPLENNDRNSSKVLEKYIMAQEDVVTYGMQMNVGLGTLLTTPGMLVDLKTIPTLDLSHSWWNANANEEYTIGGKQLAAIGDASLYNLGAPVIVMFSKTLVQENHLENPYQLVDDGKWTLDVMKEMISAAARDVNGNTEMDKEDIYGFACENGTIYYAMFSAGSRFTDRDKDGTINLALNNERNAGLAANLVTLMRNRQAVLYNSDWSKQFSSVWSDFYTPKMMANEILFYSNQLYVSLDLRAMETDFGILPMPKYDEAQEDYISVANTWFSDHIVVPVTNTDLEMTGHLLDAMGYYAQKHITPAFVDVAVKSKGTRDEDSVRMIDIILENQIFDVGLMFNWGKITDMLENMVRKTNTNFASSWAAIESVVNTELAKTVAMLKGE